MKKIKTMEEFYKVIENTPRVVVYWYTKWCPDCFMMKPALPRLEKTFDQYEFYKMDRDADINLAKHLNIYGIPSFLVFQEGKEVGRYVDKLRKSYAQVEAFLNQLES